MESLEDYLSTIFSWTNIIKENVCDSKLLVSPLKYLDKHIVDHLTLTTVRPLPGIVPLLLQLCDGVVSSYRAEHLDMEPRNLSSWHSHRSFPIGPADETANQHQQAGIVLRRFVSAVLLHCESANIITWSDFAGDVETSSATAAQTIKIRHQNGNAQGWGLNDSTKEKLGALQKYRSNLAVWYFLTSSDGRDELIIRKLGGTRARKPKWSTPQTSGMTISSPSSPPTGMAPPDASSPPWLSLLQDQQHNTRSTHTNAVSFRRITPSRSYYQIRRHLDTAITPNRPKYRYPPCKPYRPQVDEYLQRGWIHAVREDSTFLIFHCGRYERIGIRHRATQTLYLSDVIDTTKFDLYGKLQIGLYIAIIQDAMSRSDERLKREQTPNQNNRALRKRKREGAPYRASKRAKRGVPLTQPPADVIHDVSVAEMKRETESRKLMLVNFNHDHYHRSPHPASYLRREIIHSKGYVVVTNFVQPNPKNTYPSSDYMTLAVDDYIGWGASGTVYKATLSVKSGDDSTHVLREVAVKFVTKDLAKWKLEREYWIYGRLEAANVMGVPTTFGLFQDLEENWMALVMSYTGITLGTRHMSLRAGERLVSQTQREAFLRILEDIHNAGIRHRDLRWGNMTIDDDGQPHIIDFNASHLDAAKQPDEVEQEVEKMKRLLDGDEEANNISVTWSDLESDTLESRIEYLPRRIKSLLRPQADTGTLSNSDSDSSSDSNPNSTSSSNLSLDSEIGVDSVESSP
ncbi:hypothetical protein AX16_004952 [Volvariella volvacea WC 439]|nr:hypothetical protein AX16_004952 [Volvariella volvacea WC 439]